MNSIRTLSRSRRRPTRANLATAPASRVQLTTDAGTAQDLTRAFLRMGAAEVVLAWRGRPFVISLWTI